MALANPYQSYQENGILTASPSRLLIMAFDGAIRFARQGELAMKERRVDEQNRCLTRAQKIVHELMVTLDHSYAPELASSLTALYQYIIQRLVDANIHDTPEDVSEAVRHLETLRSAFAEAEALASQTAQMAAAV